MAEEDGYALMEENDYDWLYVEDDYPLSVGTGSIWLLGLRRLHVPAQGPLPWNDVPAGCLNPTIPSLASYNCLNIQLTSL